MKKNILFTAFNLDTGGVERCLVDLVNSLDKNKYNITIYLQVKEGVFLDQVDKDIKVVGYDFYKIKNKIIKKIMNVLKYMGILIKNYRKYDYSICYAPGYIPSAILALIASKKNAAWMHTNIITYMKNYKPYINKNITNEKKCKKFISRMFFRKFKNNIFVSFNAQEAYLSIYPEDKDKTQVIYNLINYKQILDKSKIKIKYKKNNIHTFINVGRQTEFDKRITRIINSCYKLKSDGYKFKFLLVGSGEDTENYKKLVKKKKLTDIITFIPNQSNPYPYFLLADTFLLSSEFEGLPTTVLESLVLGLPVISTNVSDVKRIIDNKYGVVVNNEDELYEAMKKDLNKHIKQKSKFDGKSYNKDIIEKVERLIDNE